MVMTVICTYIKQRFANLRGIVTQVGIIFVLKVYQKISLNNAVYDFSVDHSSIKKVDIINIHECFMVKNNIKKKCLG